MAIKSIDLGGLKVGEGNAPLVIAELSANHGGKLEEALNAIRAVCETGVRCIKFQTYTPETMTLNSRKEDFQIRSGTWAGSNLYELYGLAQTPYEWHAEMFSVARDCGLVAFSTPFDESAVDLLEELDCPFYKVASFECVDLELISYIASTKKPIIISTGIATKEEISNAVNTAIKYGTENIVLLHCISDYPSATQDANLAKILTLRSDFGLPIGLSDHTTNNITSIAATALGAVAIEKHFKHKPSTGPDESFSLDITQFSELVATVDRTFEALGDGGYVRALSEKNNVIFRRSLYFKRDLPAGHVISRTDIARVRPGFGLPIERLSEVIGTRLKTAVEFADRVSDEVLDR